MKILLLTGSFMVGFAFEHTPLSVLSGLVGMFVFGFSAFCIGYDCRKPPQATRREGEG
jgi:hypothetical protein